MQSRNPTPADRAPRRPRAFVGHGAISEHTNGYFFSIGLSPLKGHDRLGGLRN